MDDINDIQVRFAYKEEWQDAITLVWKTFMKFEGKEYSQEGVESFQKFITDQMLYRMFINGKYQMMLALSNGQIVGVIALRDDTHISLLFVDESYHKRGVGRKLVGELAKYLVREEGYSKMTVNAAPYAIGFYHKLGFQDICGEQENDGIRYTPMLLPLTRP